MTDQNKLLVRRYFTEVLNKGKYELIKELFSPSFIFSGPTLKKPTMGMPEGVYDFIANARHAFPDLYTSIENEIAEDNQVVAVWRMTGTHEHEFSGIKPTHKHCSITGIDIFYIENGKIEGMWAFFEMRSILEQLPENKRSASRKKTTHREKNPVKKRSKR
ncbi:MAG: ester cyclase [Bacteriovoracaceae bacterium]|nr:ester cyclase [Bacteroidota bacterium]